MGNISVDVQDVSKRFRLYHEKYSSLKEKLIHIGRIPHEDLWALREVSFDVKEGETVGILGRNGSGKSTLLKCICGVLQPTAGQVVVQGKLAGLLELGSGFQQELSGRENIYLNATMLGMSKRAVDRVFDDIVEFAELGQFIDNQVKFYSSGMYVRLGFAVAVNVDPDVLVIDEVLAVGDERFQRKCIDRVKQFQREGRTILFVSHAPDQVRSICDRAVVLSDGQVIGMGIPGEAVRIFREHLLEAGDVLALRAPTSPEPDAPMADGDGSGHGSASSNGSSNGSGHGNASGPGTATVVPAATPTSSANRSRRPIRLVEVTAISVDPDHREYALTGERLVVRVVFEASEPTEDVLFQIEVLSEGTLVFKTDTEILGLPFDAPAGPGAIDFHLDPLPLLDGAFDVNVGVLTPRGMSDWREPACRFEVANPGRSTGKMTLPVRVAVVPTEWIAS